MSKAAIEAAMEALEKRAYLSGIVPLLAVSTTYILDNAPASIAVVDVNGDGKQDLVTANNNGTVGVFLANGPGTFVYSNSISDGLGPNNGSPPAIAVAHLVSSEPNVPDLIVVNGTVHSSVFLGDGEGSFNPPNLQTAAGDVTTVAVGDLNNDGISDVVFGYSNGTIATHLGNGNGGFGGTVEQANVGLSMPITSINVADFNNDHIPDLAVGGDSGDLTVMLGNGDGSFQAATVVQSGLTPNFSIGVGDFNGDGNADLVVAQSNGTVGVLNGAGNGTFASPATFTVSPGTLSVAAADLNGDGKEDLAITNATQNNITIALGKGDGTFRSTLRSYGTGNIPMSVAVGDFAGDGKPSLATADYYGGVTVFNNISPGLFFRPSYGVGIGQVSQSVTTATLTSSGHTDLVAVSRNQNTVSISLGNGDGTFSPEPEVYSVAADPTAVEVSDLGNGHPDIVVFSPNDGVYNFTVLLGNGDGTFQAPMEFTAPLGSFGPNTFAVGDLNGDGIPDIVLAGGARDGYINVLFGNGNGTFKPPILYTTIGTNPQAIAIADLGNGSNDIIVADLDDGTPHGDVEVFMNKGNGTFNQPTTQYPVGNLPYSIALADLTGDGNLDVVTTNAESNNVSVLLGNGDGTFGATQTFPVGNFPTSVAVADFNNDGHPDLVVSSREQNAASVLLGNGDGTFTAPIMFAVGNVPETVAVGDFNGDGSPDIVVADGADYNLSVLLDESSSLAFSPLPQISTINAPSSIATGDLTNNGKTDLVEVDKQAKTMEVYLANGDGSFKQPEVYSVSNYPSFVEMSDINGDGIPDIVVASAQEGSVNIFLGNGNGTFKPEIVTTLPSGLSPGPNVLGIADFNHDGKPDLVVAAGEGVYVLMGNGDGTFQAPKTYTLSGGANTVAQGVVTGDFNGDGNPDFVVTAEYTSGMVDPGEAVVFLNNGNGTFALSSYSMVGIGPVGVAIADLNGDHIPDIITANAQDGTVSVLQGNGDGTFKPAQTFLAGYDPSGIAIADMNGDGIPDIAVVDYGSVNGPNSTVSVLLGNNTPGAAPFDAPLAFDVGDGAISLAVGDLNGDGSNDIVTTNKRGYSLSVLLNATTRSPAITSPNNLELVSGDYGSVNVSAVGIPTATFTESGALPAGVTFHDDGNGSATISGTPTAAAGGVYLLTLSASNGVQAPGKQLFNITVDQAPVFTSSANATFTVGSAGSFTISTSAFPAPSITEIGSLPTGVSFIENGNGSASLAGTPAAMAGGNFVITLVAANGIGSANQTFTLALDTAPTFISPVIMPFVVGTPGSELIGAVGFPTPTITETGSIPNGMSFLNSGNGSVTLVGTPGANSGGTYVITFTASNGVAPAATAAYTFTVDQPPSITSANMVTLLTGSTGTFTVSSSAFPLAAFAETPAPPAGLTFVDNGNGTATVSGATTVPGGDYVLTIVASNGIGAPANQVFTLVLDQSPSFVGGTSTTFVAGTAGSFMIGTTGFPISSLSKKGKLPSSVTFHDNGNGTATIGGVPNALTGGVYVLTLTATNGISGASGVGGAGTATEMFTLTVNQAPAFTSSSTAAFATSASGTFAITTMGPPASTFTEAGTLPSGLSFADNGNGTAAIFGTAAANANGTYTVTITASNGIAPIATQLLSVVVQTATITMGGDGTITAMGTDANGSTAVSYSGGMVALNIDGQSQTFAVTNVSTVNIALGNGDDNVSIGNNVPLSLMIVGGSGSDTIMATNTMPDTINGGGGNNSIVAGNAADVIHGGSGNNTVAGGGPGTLIVGGAGNNVLAPATNSQTVRGGQGNDTIVGSGGDSLHGGTGNNIFLNSNDSGDTIDGGTGLDFVENNANDTYKRVYEVLDPPAPQPGQVQPAIALTGAISPLVESAVTAEIVAGHLKIFGSDGDDSISISSNGTKLTVDSGATVIGKFALSAVSGIRVDASPGNDTVTVQQSITLPATILGGGGMDSFTGGGGSNVLIGGGGSTTLVGGAGTNLLVPGERLTFSGSASIHDSLVGGSGYTIADFSRRTDNLSLSNDGLPDSGDAGQGEDITIAANVSAIWGGTGSDTIVASKGGEFISGGAGSNSVHGGGMGDVLVGGLGRDTVVVAAEPVSLFLANGKVDDYSGVSDPAIDILKLDSKDVLTS